MYVLDLLYNLVPLDTTSRVPELQQPVTLNSIGIEVNEPLSFIDRAIMTIILFLI